MKSHVINKTMRVVEYIEENLTEKLELHVIAKALDLSLYYLHRTFSHSTGMTIHNYLRRRQLTEAARMLTCSDRAILDIALLAGYENQQSFSKIFKLMYKDSPESFRKKQSFYPLQQPLEFLENPDDFAGVYSSHLWNIRFAKRTDIPGCMNLARLVVDGYPLLKEEEHINALERYIEKKQALIVSDRNILIGSMLFSYQTGSIDFLGVHPLYRGGDLFNILIYKSLSELFAEKATVSTTTYREGDKADPGYRKRFKAFGFLESELLVEFGYPTQKFVFYKNSEQESGFGE